MVNTKKEKGIILECHELGDVAVSQQLIMCRHRRQSMMVTPIEKYEYREEGIIFKLYYEASTEYGHFQ